MHVKPLNLKPCWIYMIHWFFLIYHMVLLSGVQRLLFIYIDCKVFSEKDILYVRLLCCVLFPPGTCRWVLLLVSLHSALMHLFFISLSLSFCIWLLRIRYDICWPRGSLYGVLPGCGGLGIHRPSIAVSLELCLFWLYSLGYVVSVPCWLFRLLGWHILLLIIRLLVWCYPIF